jgi:hypothetical protein
MSNSTHAPQPTAHPAPGQGQGNGPAAGEAVERRGRHAPPLVAPAVIEAARASAGRESREAAQLDTGNVARSEVRGPLAAPVELPVSPLIDTGNTGNTEIDGVDDQLAILANQEIGNERFDPSEWRIEVYTNRNGRRYWNLRRRGKRGGKANWKFGGKFDGLSQERQEQYWQRAKGG